MDYNKNEEELVSMTYEEFLIQSARYGDFSEVDICLKEENIDPNCHDYLNNTPLRIYYYFYLKDMAAANGHLDIVKELIRYRADANIKNLSDNTPLRAIIFMMKYRLGST